MIHTVGLIVCATSIPILFVRGSWKANLEDEPINQDYAGTPHEASTRLVNFSSLFKTRLFWIANLTFGILQPCTQFMTLSYPLFLTQGFKFSEKEASVHTTIALILGILSCVFLNLSNKLKFWCKTLFVVSSVGIIMISIACFIIRADNFEVGWIAYSLIIIGEALWGIGTIGNIGFTNMVVSTMFPFVDKNLIIAFPTWVGNFSGLLFNWLFTTYYETAF